MERQYKCNFCPYATTHSFILMQHVNRYHKGIYDVACQEPNCNKTFKTWLAFKNHVSKYHRRTVLPRNLPAQIEEHGQPIEPDNQENNNIILPGQVGKYIYIL